MEGKKKYGGRAAFLGSILLVCSGVIAYNIHMISVFKELDYTYPLLSGDANALQVFFDKYFSLFASFFGRYPSTKVLAAVIPITIITLIYFFDYLIKYIKQEQQNKINRFFPEEENNNDESAIQG